MAVTFENCVEGLFARLVWENYRHLLSYYCRTPNLISARNIIKAKHVDRIGSRYMPPLSEPTDSFLPIRARKLVSRAKTRMGFSLCFIPRRPSVFDLTDAPPVPATWYSTLYWLHQVFEFLKTHVESAVVQSTVADC